MLGEGAEGAVACAPVSSGSRIGGSVGSGMSGVRGSGRDSTGARRGSGVRVSEVRGVGVRAAPRWLRPRDEARDVERLREYERLSLRECERLSLRGCERLSLLVCLRLRLCEWRRRGERERRRYLCRSSEDGDLDVEDGERLRGLRWGLSCRDRNSSLSAFSDCSCRCCWASACT